MLSDINDSKGRGCAVERFDDAPAVENQLAGRGRIERRGIQPFHSVPFDRLVDDPGDCREHRHHGVGPRAIIDLDVEDRDHLVVSFHRDEDSIEPTETRTDAGDRVHRWVQTGVEAGHPVEVIDLAPRFLTDFLALDRIRRSVESATAEQVVGLGARVELNPNRAQPAD